MEQKYFSLISEIFIKKKINYKIFILMHSINGSKYARISEGDNDIFRAYLLILFWFHITIKKIYYNYIVVKMLGYLDYENDKESTKQKTLWFLD